MNFLNEKQEDKFEIWWRYKPTGEEGTSKTRYSKRDAERVMDAMKRSNGYQYEYWLEQVK